MDDQLRLFLDLMETQVSQPTVVFTEFGLRTVLRCAGLLSMELPSTPNKSVPKVNFIASINLFTDDVAGKDPVIVRA